MDMHNRNDSTNVDSLNLTKDGELYRIYPTQTHWVLIKESMASEILVRLCRRSDGLAKAWDLSHKYIGENE